MKEINQSKVVQIQTQNHEREQQLDSLEKEAEAKKKELQIEIEQQQREFEKRKILQIKELEQVRRDADLLDEQVVRNQKLLRIETEAAEQKSNNRDREIELNEKEHYLAQSRFRSNMKKLFTTLLMLFFVAALCLLLYWLYRLAFESPIIKEVTRTVEVPIEKIVEKSVEIPVEVVPEECSQVRRNGKIFMNCDGVKIEGSPTIEASGVELPPELLPEQ